MRGASTSGYSLLYPLLIAPAYALADLVDAHAAGAVDQRGRDVAGRDARPTRSPDVSRPTGLALLVAAGTVSCRRWRTPGRSPPRASSTRSRSCVALVARPLPRAAERGTDGRARRAPSPWRSRRARRPRVRPGGADRTARPRAAAGPLGRPAPGGAARTSCFGAGLVAVVVLQALRGRSLARPARRRTAWSGEARYDVGQVLRYLALGEPGARPVPRDRPGRGARRAAHRPRRASARGCRSTSPRRLARGAWSLARGRGVHVAVRLRPGAGSVPLLPRPAAARLLAAWARSARRDLASSPPSVPRRVCCSSSPSRSTGSSASLPSPTPSA